MKKTIVLMLLVLVLMAVAVNCQGGRKKLSNEELKADVLKLKYSNVKEHGHLCYHGCGVTKHCRCSNYCCKPFYFGIRICVEDWRYWWIPCIPPQKKLP
ncbi:Uncharacterised protein g7138 [Pycnogonum litorale]